VTVAYEGPSAIAAAGSLDPDLAFLDIGLPGMDGYSVASQLRHAGYTRTVLVALSGYGQAEFQQRSRAAGFDRHLVKPVELSLVQEIVATTDLAGTR
jgi:two-component system CheB/CheR fusion protein